MQRLKGGSAVIGVKEGHARSEELRWAKGYNIYSVSPRALHRLREYIRRQPQRHPAEAIPDVPNGASFSSLYATEAEPPL
jgi:hypothetical protein